MADNSNPTLVKRLAKSAMAIPAVVVPPMPQVPKIFIRRFPEWEAYQTEMERWRDSFQQELSRALTKE